MRRGFVVEGGAVQSLQALATETDCPLAHRKYLLFDYMLTMPVNLRPLGHNDHRLFCG
jgi:hypothetical protein